MASACSPNGDEAGLRYVRSTYPVLRYRRIGPSGSLRTVNFAFGPKAENNERFSFHPKHRQPVATTQPCPYSTTFTGRPAAIEPLP
jgi:hypothetical protein